MRNPFFIFFDPAMYNILNQSLKTQVLEVSFGEKQTKANILETNAFRGIPYSDYFNVLTEWKIIHNKVPSGVKNVTPMVKVEVFLEFKFFKSTWLQGTIEANTKSELIEVCSLWLDAAKKTVQDTMDKRHIEEIFHKQSIDIEEGHAQHVLSTPVPGMKTIKVLLDHYHT